MPGPSREITLAEYIDRLPEGHGARARWDKIFAVVCELAVSECEADCGNGQPRCLVCRARDAVAAPAQYWTREEIQRAREQLGERGFAAEFQMNPGVGATVLCRSCRGPAGRLSGRAWMRMQGEMGWSKVLAEHFSVKCERCCVRDDEAYPAIRYEGAAPGWVEFDGCPIEPMDQRPDGATRPPEDHDAQ